MHTNDSNPIPLRAEYYCFLYQRQHPANHFGRDPMQLAQSRTKKTKKHAIAVDFFARQDTGQKIQAANFSF
jgi:hypothetical protein